MFILIIDHQGHQHPGDELSWLNILVTSDLWAYCLTFLIVSEAISLETLGPQFGGLPQMKKMINITTELFLAFLQCKISLLK